MLSELTDKVDATLAMKIAQSITVKVEFAVVKPVL